MPYSRYLIGQLPWYSVLVVTGMFLAVCLASSEEKRVGLSKDTILDLALWLIPTGILGARFYYVLFSWDQFKDNPISALYIWNGGLAIYGGIIAGALTAIFFARHRKIPIMLLLDLIAPGVALAQSIGRWGNFFNMEAFGSVVTNPSFQFFPFAVLIPEGSGNVWHLATFFYESIWNFLVFASLWLSRKAKKQVGDTALHYFLLYGAGRFWIEGLRSDSLMIYPGNGRVSQWLSAGACMVVLGVFAFRLIRSQKKPLAQLIAFLFTALPFASFLVWCSTSEANRLFITSVVFSLLCILSLLILYYYKKSEETHADDCPEK